MHHDRAKCLTTVCAVFCSDDGVGQSQDNSIVEMTQSKQGGEVVTQAVQEFALTATPEAYSPCEVSVTSGGVIKQQQQLPEQLSKPADRLQLSGRYELRLNTLACKMVSSYAFNLCVTNMSNFELFYTAALLNPQLICQKMSINFLTADNRLNIFIITYYFPITDHPKAECTINNDMR